MEKYNFNRIVFVYSYKCNMNCPYCMHAKHKIRTGDSKKLGLQNAQNIMNKILQYSKYDFLLVTFSGGEPLIYFKEFILPLVSYYKNNTFGKKIKFEIYTNGTLITNQIIDFCKNFDVKIAISYDGHKGQEHRNFEFLSKVENNISLCIDNLPENLFAIQSTYDDKSIPYIYDAYLTMKNFKIKNWSFAVDSLTSERRNSFQDCITFGDQVNLIWKDYQKEPIMNIRNFYRISHYSDYVQDNQAIIVRPDGEIGIGTVAPILIPKKAFELLKLGYYDIDEDKYQTYRRVLGNFNSHNMGKNIPNFCNMCKLKKDCQVYRTPMEQEILTEADPIHCLFYLFTSLVMDGKWEILR